MYLRERVSAPVGGMTRGCQLRVLDVHAGGLVCCHYWRGVAKPPMVLLSVSGSSGFVVSSHLDEMSFLN